jgi:hypothetical protein
MIQRGDDLRFGDEPPSHLFGAKDLGSRQLEGDQPAEYPVVGSENDAVPAAADLVQDLETANLEGCTPHVTGVSAFGKRVSSSLEAVALRRGLRAIGLRLGVAAFGRHALVPEEQNGTEMVL